MLGIAIVLALFILGRDKRREFAPRWSIEGGVKRELLLQILGLEVLVRLLDCILEVQGLLVEHVVQLVEALPFHALFLLDVR